jgi:site-specific DNA-methyltransferase (adenine-specific)
MRLLLGDCLDKLKELKDNSVDSIVTDPPYGLSFMGKKWDYDVPSVDIWQECLRVLKPGGYLLSFAGSRTYHRMAVRIEDAGFEIRDQIMWIYGSGFPKSMDISKQIDKSAGKLEERKVIGQREDILKKQAKDLREGKRKIKETFNGESSGNGFVSVSADITEPVTDGAKQWQGWGTSLKPAHEPIVMARKPIVGTVAQNVLEWGTGGINIDECRVDFVSEEDKNESTGKNQHADFGSTMGTNQVYGDYSMLEPQNYNPTGRFPANVILDKEAGKVLDEQSGTSKSTGGRSGNKNGIGSAGIYGKYDGQVSNEDPGFGDVGGASRFFYCPKTSKSDRNEGCEKIEPKSVGTLNANSADLENYGGSSLGGASLKGEHKNPEPKNNFHPTVKPTDLMGYLIRLVTPKGGVVLDPFMGSGSTGKAAVREGMDFVGVERESEYFEIAEARIQYEIDRPTTIVKQKIEKKSVENKVVETKFW